MEGIDGETDFMVVVSGLIGAIFGLVCCSIYISRKKNTEYYNDNDALIYMIISMIIGFIIGYVILVLISIIFL